MFSAQQDFWLRQDAHDPCEPPLYRTAISTSAFSATTSAPPGPYMVLALRSLAFSLHLTLAYLLSADSYASGHDFFVPFALCGSFA